MRVAGELETANSKLIAKGVDRTLFRFRHAVSALSPRCVEIEIAIEIGHWWSDHDFDFEMRADRNKFLTIGIKEESLGARNRLKNSAYEVSPATPFAAKRS